MGDLKLMMNFSTTRVKAQKECLWIFIFKRDFHHDGDGALSFVIARRERKKTLSHHQDTEKTYKTNKRRNFTFSHSFIKIWWSSRCRLMVCLPRQLRSRFSFSLWALDSALSWRHVLFANQFQRPAMKKQQHEKLMSLFMFPHAPRFRLEAVKQFTWAALLEKNRDVRRFSRETSWLLMLFVCFHVSSSTMGNNGLKLIQLFHRDTKWFKRRKKREHKKIIWLLFRLSFLLGVP